MESNTREALFKDLHIEGQAHETLELGDRVYFVDYCVDKWKEKYDKFINPDRRPPESEAKELNIPYQGYENKARDVEIPLSDNWKKVYMFKKQHKDFEMPSLLTKIGHVQEDEMNIPYLTTDDLMMKRFDFDPDGAMKKARYKKDPTGSEFYLHNQDNFQSRLNFHIPEFLPKEYLKCHDDLITKVRQNRDHRTINKLILEQIEEDRYFKEESVDRASKRISELFSSSTTASSRSIQNPILKPKIIDKDHIASIKKRLLNKKLFCLKHNNAPVAAICLSRACTSSRLSCSSCFSSHIQHLSNLLILRENELSPCQLAVKLGTVNEVALNFVNIENDWNDYVEKMLQKCDNMFNYWCFDKVNQELSRFRASFEAVKLAIYNKKNDLKLEFKSRKEKARETVANFYSVRKLLELVQAYPTSKHQLRTLIHGDLTAVNERLFRNYLQVRLDDPNDTKTLANRVRSLKNLTDIEFRELKDEKESEKAKAYALIGYAEAKKMLQDLERLETLREVTQRWKNFSLSQFRVRLRVRVAHYKDHIESVVAQRIYRGEEEILTGFLVLCNNKSIYRIEWPTMRKHKLFRDCGVFGPSDFRHIVTKKMLMPCHPYRANKIKDGEYELAKEYQDVLYSSENSAIINVNNRRGQVVKSHIGSCKSCIIMDLRKQNGSPRGYSVMLCLFSFEIGLYSLKTGKNLRNCYGENMWAFTAFYDGVNVVVSSDSKTNRLLIWNTQNSVPLCETNPSRSQAKKLYNFQLSEDELANENGLEEEGVSHIIVGSSTRSLFFWNWKSGAVIRTFQVIFDEDHSISIDNVQFPKFYDNTYRRLMTFCFCFTSSKFFKLHNWKTGELLMEFPCRENQCGRPAMAFTNISVIQEDGLPNQAKAKMNQPFYQLSRSEKTVRTTVMALPIDSDVQIRV